MRSTVRQGRVISKIDETKRAIAGGNIMLARGLINEIADMDPNTPELPSLREMADKADRSGGQNNQVPDRNTKANETPRPTPPTKEKDKPKAQNATPTPPTTPTGTTDSAAGSTPTQSTAADSKTYYADGLKELQAGNTEKAIELLDKCVKADTKNGMCYRALGISYARLKNGPKAAKYYRMYLRVMPDAKDAKQVEELLKAYEGAATP